jgi:hypothetical protein
MKKVGVAERVAALGDLSRLDLIELWVKRYGVEPPVGMRQPMLLRAEAGHIQEKQLGGLSPICKRLLKSAMKRIIGQPAKADAVDGRAGADDAAAAKCPSPDELTDRSASPRAVPLPGARLIREWNGRRYVVEVTDAGFVMDGKIYRSLTAIAFRITGVKWSGPRFFGL